MKKVLIVEDDPDILELVSLHIRDMNCEVIQAQNGTDGLQLAFESHFDLIILDLMLPGTDGISICQKLRALNNFTPILMLTAKSEEFDKVMGLESGADDYLTKPFGIRELVARVKSLFRRNEYVNAQANTHPGVIERGDLSIQIERRVVTKAGERLNLTPTEFQLLLLLAEHPGRSYSREELISNVWGHEFDGYDHTVNSHVNRLRAKLEPHKTSPNYIKTTWGVGYRFNEEL